MKRLICWWRGHHDWTRWQQGAFITYRYCKCCEKEQVSERDVVRV